MCRYGTGSRWAADIFRVGRALFQNGVVHGEGMIWRAVRWRLIAYPILAFALWSIGGWPLVAATPVLLETEAALRRYEEWQSLPPESRHRPLAKLRRGMNWDARFDGWVGLALLAGLLAGAESMWLGPVLFEAVLTVHRVLPRLRPPPRRRPGPLPGRGRVIMPPPRRPRPPDAGVREPRRPLPTGGRGLAAERSPGRC